MVRIEPFGNHDVLELVRMWRASFEHGVGVRDPHPIEAQVDYFRAKLVPRYAIDVAMRDESIAGFMASDAESIASLHVRVEDLGKGIGSQLLEIAKGRSGGSLWLYTFARNAGARRFYEGRGFTAVRFGFEPEWQLEDVRYEWRAPR